MQSTIPNIVMSFGAFSLAWFALGIMAGRRLPERRKSSRQGRSGSRSSRGGTRRRPVELYVGNLSYDMSERELHKTFRKYGNVVSARIISNKFNGKSRGFGFVQMDDPEEIKAAIKALHGKEVKGRKIVVNEAK